MILIFYLERPRLSETPFFKFSLLPASLKLSGQFILSRPCRLASTDSLFFIRPSWGADLLLDDAFGIEAGASEEVDLQGCNRPGYAETMRRTDQRRIPNSPINVR